MKINVRDLQFYKDNFEDIQVNTPDGYQNIGEVYHKPNKVCLSVSFSNGDIIECSVDHLFQMQNGWVKSIDLKEGDTSIDGFKVLQIINIGIHDTYDLEVLHPNHRYYSENIVSHNTGKTLVALSAAMRLIDTHRDKYDKIVYIRKTVVSDSEELGFLKGSLEEKIQGFLAPLYSNLEYIIGKKYNNRKSKLTQDELNNKLDDYINKYQIQFKYEGHLRGSNIRNAIVILDECLSETQILETTKGKMSIKDICDLIINEDIYVKSYSHKLKKYTFEKINSIKKQIIDETDEEMYEISFEKDGISQTIQVTGNHRLFVNNSYKYVKDIKEKDLLFTSNNDKLEGIRISSIKKIPYDGFIYTPSVDNNHNYMLGDLIPILSKNCQNNSISSVKTILTRISENCKVFILGSTKQIDTAYLNKYNNALTYLMRKIGKNNKNVNVAGYVLDKTVRSAIAEWADSFGDEKN